MAKKYLRNTNGIVRAVTSDNLQLEKPLLNENYDIEVHNRNMDKIDSAIQEVKGKIDGLELVASNVKMADGTTVEDTVSSNKTSILNNTELVNQALTKANEAFQRGDNVKTQLVDKLISEGLDVSTNNTFEELIGEIALGKKWASGNGTTNGMTCTVNADLKFEPSMIFVILPSVTWYDVTSNKNICLCNDAKYEVDIGSKVATGFISNISKSSFQINISYYYTSKINNYIWYAFE